MISFDEAKDISKDIRSSGVFAKRDEANREMENIFLLTDPGDLPDAKHIKKTLSPDGRNSLQGAARLLGASDPKWSVPEDMNQLLDQSSSNMEKVADAIWQAAGRTQGRPRHYDAILSGLLYGEVIIAVTCTKDLVDSAPPQLKMRMEDVYANTPLLFDTIQPAGAYPVYDNLGLSVFHSFRDMSVRDIKQRWANAASLLEGVKDNERKTVAEYWDYEAHFVWIDGVDGVLINAKNDWGFIPISAGITEGSDLFVKADQYTRQPFLYTMWKSEMWKRQNLSLTVMFSRIFAIGANPQNVWKRNDQNKAAPLIDYSNVDGTIVLDQGEEYGSASKNVIDPSLMTGLDIAQTKGIESTIYRQALGEPLGANAPFSMVAMLSQAGRLPLIPYQRMTSHVLGDAMAKGLRMLQVHKESFSVREQKSLVEVDATAFPERIEIECTLDIDMPQDQQANAQIASALTAGDTPLMSIETAQKRYLGIEQPEEEQLKVWNERAATVQFMNYLQQQQQMAQQQQMQPQQGVPPEMMGQGGMQPGMGQLTPEMEQMLMQNMNPGIQQPGGMPNPQSTGAQPGIPGVPLPGPLPPEGTPEGM